MRVLSVVGGIDGGVVVRDLGLGGEAHEIEVAVEKPGDNELAVNDGADRRWS